MEIGCGGDKPIIYNTRFCQLSIDEKTDILDRLVIVGSEHYFDPELVFEDDLQVVEIDGTVGRLHGQLNAGPEVKDVDGPVKIVSHFLEELKSGEGESGTVTAIGHGDQFDLVVPGKLAVLL
jgi:hypothetical protein